MSQEEQKVVNETIAKKYKRTTPQSDLDFSFMTTDPVYGKPEVSDELKTRLNRLLKAQNETGEEINTIESLWGLLGYYTRDMRLANLSYINGEIQYCQYFLDLAGDFLQANQIEPFIICLSRVATVLELSQSKGGFLRRRMNTFTHEQHHRDEEPPKKSLFGSGGKRQ